MMWRRRRLFRRRLLMPIGFMMIAVIVCVLVLARRAGAQASAYELSADIPYATHEGYDANATSLDIYAAEGAQAQPVVLWIHGGGWSFGDKAHVNAKPEFFTSNGFVFVSINYRLIPSVQFPANVQDVADAIAWVERNIAEYGGDPTRMFVMGHSAGAHLAALISTDGSYLANAGIHISNLDGTILLDGAGYDIPLHMADAGRRARATYEAAFGTDPTGWQLASPITHVAPDSGIPPFLIIHVASRADSRLQSERLADALQAAGVPAQVYAAEGKSHMTLNRELGEPNDEPTAWVLAFLQGGE